MAFVTGRHMCHRHSSQLRSRRRRAAWCAWSIEDRVEFHDGDDELAPGVTLHRIGGHTAGLQWVRVHTKRGWVVLASDASHYYEHFERAASFPRPTISAT